MPRVDDVVSTVTPQQPVRRALHVDQLVAKATNGRFDQLAHGTCDNRATSHPLCIPVKKNGPARPFFLFLTGWGRVSGTQNPYPGSFYRNAAATEPLGRICQRPLARVNGQTSIQPTQPQPGAPFQATDDYITARGKLPRGVHPTRSNRIPARTWAAGSGSASPDWPAGCVGAFRWRYS